MADQKAALKARLDESKATVDAFFAWRDAEAAHALDETPTVAALGYFGDGVEEQRF